MVVISGDVMGEVFILVGIGARCNCVSRVIDSCDSVVMVEESGGVSTTRSVVGRGPSSTNAS